MSYAEQDFWRGYLCGAFTVLSAGVIVTIAILL